MERLNVESKTQMERDSLVLGGDHVVDIEGRHILIHIGRIHKFLYLQSWRFVEGQKETSDKRMANYGDFQGHLRSLAYI